MVPNACRNASIKPEHALLGVTGVAAEKLVAAIAAENLFDASLARDLGAVIRRQHRRIPEGLVVGAGHHRDAVDQIGRGDIVFMMLGAEVPRSDARVLHLVVSGCIEADRKGLRCRARYLAKQAGNRRTIGAAAQEAANTRGA